MNGIKIFIEGVQASIDGTDPRLCPYDKMTKERAEWDRGQYWGAQIMLSRREVLDYDTEK